MCKNADWAIRRLTGPQLVGPTALKVPMPLDQFSFYYAVLCGDDMDQWLSVSRRKDGYAKARKIKMNETALAVRERKSFHKYLIDTTRHDLLIKDNVRSNPFINMSF